VARALANFRSQLFAVINSYD